ncbi:MULTISPECIES: ABC transporter ATP-binding protein [unclassified Jeotgalibaca]|uniref:ABC transporter ATP-binding protein n=1 Tax=unclassified Jeotgalibaca TaxID=2621505 RepID=UPI003FD1AE48
MNQTRKLSQLLQLWDYLKPYKVHFISAIVLTVIMSVLNVAEPYILGLAITEIGNNIAAMLRDNTNTGINYPYIYRIMLIYFGRALVYQATILFSQRFMTKVVQSAMEDLRADLDGKLNRLPVSFFDSQSYGDVLSRVTNDVDAVSNALQQALLQIVNAVLGILFAVTMLVLISWKLALVAFIMIPTSYFLSKKITVISQPYFSGQAKYLGQLNGFVQENLSGFSVVKLYGKEDDSVTEFETINNQLRQSGFKAAFISGLMSPLTALASNLGYIGMAGFGIFQVVAGTLTIGNVQAAAQYVWQINQPITMITQLAGVIQSAAAATQRIFGLMNEEEMKVDDTKTLPSEIKGDISFENVSFSYSPKEPLVRDFNVDVKSGDTVAIVGPTGAGKTTMINLLMRFYDVDSGSIKLDGEDIRSYSRQDYRSQFGMVLQDAWLYQGTIADNIRFGKLDATDEEVRKAAEAANVDHFIQTLSDGYDTVINQEASNISLGQKQLLTIARTFIADPKVLILDEATSSVDTRLEMLIQKAMSTIMEGRTSFVIAHRLSTIRDADLILVMNKGQIIEQGSHDTLIEQKGFYHDLYNSQFQE